MEISCIKNKWWYNFNILKVAGIYGPNNAGKTCLVRCIRAIRNVRSGMNVPPSKKAKVFVVSENEKLRNIFENGHIFFGSYLFV